MNPETCCDVKEHFGCQKMLINVMHPEEARVAIVCDGRMVELTLLSGKEQTAAMSTRGLLSG
jgi:ribonuclease E